MATPTTTDPTAIAIWTALARRSLEVLAYSRPAFSTDDLWALLEGFPVPADPRALGPILTYGKDAHLIAKTDFATASRRAACHARPIAVWRSIPLRATEQDAAAYVLGRKPEITAPPLLPFDPITSAS